MIPSVIDSNKTRRDSDSMGDQCVLPVPTTHFVSLSIERRLINKICAEDECNPEQATYLMAVLLIVS